MQDQENISRGQLSDCYFHSVSGISEGATNTSWVSWKTKAMRKVSDLTYIMPGDRPTFEQLLQLLGDCGFDL